jgi:hypothetical protein
MSRHKYSAEDFMPRNFSDCIRGIAVVLNGKLFPRATLDAMLAKAQTLANMPDAAASGK